MRNKSKYSEFCETYKILKGHFWNSTQLRHHLNLLNPEQRKYVLRATHFINLARKNKFLDLSLSGFLVSNAAEVMGRLIYNKGPTQNHSLFLSNYGDLNLLSILSKNEKYEERFYDESKKEWNSTIIRRIENAEILNIYYCVVRCLFTHEGERHLMTMERRTVNCGTVCTIFPYKLGNKVRYKFGTEFVSKNKHKFIIVNFHYDTYEKLVLNCLVKFIKNP